MSPSRDRSPFVNQIESLVVPTAAGTRVEPHGAPFVDEVVVGERLALEAPDLLLDGEESLSVPAYADAERVIDEAEREDGEVWPTDVLAQEEVGPDASELTLIERALRRGGSPSENIITNHLFERRHPELKGRALRASETALVREWRKIRDSQVRPYVRHSLKLHEGLDPMLLAMYLSQYEGDKRVPPKAEMTFLRDPPLLSMGRSLRDRVLWNWHSGQPPLSVSRFFDLAFELVANTGYAALLCHNVAKAFSRDGVAIHWQKMNPAEGRYTGSGKDWVARKRHRDGILVQRPKGPSIFYVLFSAKEFGTEDDGDWYHHFVAATVSAFGTIADRAGGPGSAPGRRELEWQEEDEAVRDRVRDVVERAVYPILVRDALGRLRSQMSDPASVATTGYRGWVLANALSFLEGAHFGTTQIEVARESKAHLRGAVFGVQRAGASPQPSWRWYVPSAGSVGKAGLLTGFALSAVTAETWSPASA